MSGENKTKKGIGTYETLALAEHAKKKYETNIYNPSDENVEEAKDWVDYNEK